MFNRDSALSNRHEGRLEFFIEEVTTTHVPAE